MTDEKSDDLHFDATWIGGALIPRWHLFRRSFVERSNLTPVLVYGGADNSAGDGGYTGQKLFPEGAHWAAIDIERPDVNPADVHFARDVHHGAFWDIFQRLNAVAWCPRGRTFAAFSGSDTLCLLSAARAIEAAFDRPIEALDDLIFDRVQQTLDEQEHRVSVAFDDVWLRGFAWLHCFR
jgi:hypothetical protein